MRAHIQNRQSFTITLILAAILIQVFTSFGAEESWTEMAPMPTARWAHEAEVIDGKIYAIGGVLANRTETGANEVYDPATDTWTSKAPMPTARGGAGSAVVNGRIYMIGGAEGFVNSNPFSGFQTLTTVEEYDPATDTWTTKASMPTRRVGMATFVVGTKIHVISGWRGQAHDDFPNIIEVYDPLTDSWVGPGNVPISARGNFAVSEANGRMYQFGGTRPGTSGGRETTEFDPSQNTWTPKALMPAPRHIHSASTLEEKIYVMGGNPGTGSSVASVYVYDPQEDSWGTGLTMPRVRGSFETITLNGKIYAFGGLSGYAWGSRGTIYASMDVYTPASVPGQPEIESVVRTSSGSVIVTIPEGETYDIEYSQDLTPGSWTVIRTSVSGGYEDTDPIRNARSKGFYRGVR